MNSIFRKYIDIINEAAAPAGVKPTAPQTAYASYDLSPEQQDRLSDQTGDVAGYYKNQEYGKTERTYGDNGRSEQVNKLTGIKTVSDPEKGTQTYDAGGNLIKTDDGAFGFSKSVDAKTGDTTQGFKSGDVSVGSTTTPGGYEKSKDSSYQMGALNVAQSEKAPDYASGALAAPKTTTATYQKSADKGDVAQGTATTGVAFGGASGANVGKNTITTGDKDLADVATQFANPSNTEEQPVSENEEPESIRDLLKKILDIVRDHEGEKEPEDDKKEEPIFGQEEDSEEEEESSDEEDSEEDEEDEEEVTESENLYQREYEVAESKIEESLRSLLKAIKEGK